jgi:hypothetical protein
MVAIVSAQPLVTCKRSGITLVTGSTNDPNCVIETAAALESTIRGVVKQDRELHRLVVNSLLQLAETVREISNLNAVTEILSNSQIRIPHYFRILEENADKSNPVFYSVNLESVSVNLKKYAERIAKYARTTADTHERPGYDISAEIARWHNSLGEFLLHEIGHIAHESGVLRLREDCQEDLTRTRSKFIKQFSLNTPERETVLNELKWHEGDLLAEAFRSLFDFPERLKGAYISKAVADHRNIQVLGRIVTAKSSDVELIGFSAWLVVAEAFSPQTEQQMKAAIPDLSTQQQKFVTACYAYLKKRFAAVELAGLRLPPRP